jgi:hypothetical protein
MRRASAALALVIAGCVTPGPGAAPRVLPEPALVVPSRWDCLAAIEHVRERIESRGFLEEFPRVLEPGEALEADPAGSRRLTRGTRSLDGDRVEAGQPAACLGETEVIQVRVLTTRSGSELRMSCHTERLVSGPGACGRLLERGCARRGDAVLGELALQAVRTL